MGQKFFFIGPAAAPMGSQRVAAGGRDEEP